MLPKVGQLFCVVTQGGEKLHPFVKAGRQNGGEVKRKKISNEETLGS